MATQLSSSSSASAPGFVIVGQLPEALLDLVKADDSEKSCGGRSAPHPALITRLEGVSFEAETGLPHLAHTQKVITGSTSENVASRPAIVVESVAHKRTWRADLSLDSTLPDDGASSAMATVSRQQDEAGPSTGTGETFTLPRRAILRICSSSWHEVLQAPEIKPQPEQHSHAPPHEQAHEESTRDVEKIEEVDKTNDVPAETSSQRVPSTTPTPAPPSQPCASMLARDAVSSDALLDPAGPHAALVQILIHALAVATNPQTLAQVMQPISAKLSQLKTVYHAEDVRYVLDNVLCENRTPRSSSSSTLYTLKPTILAKYVDVTDFPRGTAQRVVAAKLFKCLDADDAVQREKRDALAYLVDPDLVLAASGSHDWRHHGGPATTATTASPAPPPAHNEQATVSESASAAVEPTRTATTPLPALSSESASRKRAAPTDDTQGGSQDGGSADGHRPPVRKAHRFTTLQQLDVHWDDGDLRVLVPDAELSGLEKQLAALQTRLSEAGLANPHSTAATPVLKGAAKKTKKKSKQASKAPEDAWLRPCPIQSADAHTRAAELYRDVTQCYATVSAKLTANEAVKTETERWLARYPEPEHYSPDVWAGMLAYWLGQAARLDCLRPMCDQLSDARYRLYRDLRDYEDMTAYGVWQ